MHILLVEDEARVAAFVEQGLREEGYQVTWVTEGAKALTLGLEQSFDIVLLDIRLPDLSGIEVCRQLRVHAPALPILMLTALDAVEDRVAGLRAGADDYLPKPFAFNELLARMDALSRRARLVPGNQTRREGQLVLDPVARTCLSDGISLDLTQKEFDLLAYFIVRKEQALRREDIHRDVWGHDFDRGTNLIDVYVGYVRRKLQDAGSVARIEAVRGVGYRFLPEPL
ncbi:MAG: response regulator transcription factor [Rhodothermales bacterium]|nr:response regulator transcription factor [Rhodothermales bacterium]